MSYEALMSEQKNHIFEGNEDVETLKSLIERFKEDNSLLHSLPERWESIEYENQGLKNENKYLQTENLRLQGKILSLREENVRLREERVHSKEGNLRLQGGIKPPMEKCMAKEAERKAMEMLR